MFSMPMIEQQNSQIYSKHHWSQNVFKRNCRYNFETHCMVSDKSTFLAWFEIENETNSSTNRIQSLSFTNSDLLANDYDKSSQVVDADSWTGFFYSIKHTVNIENIIWMLLWFHRNLKKLYTNTKYCYSIHRKRINI